MREERKKERKKREQAQGEGGKRKKTLERKEKEILICSDGLRHLLRDSNGLVSNRFRIIFGERIPSVW